MRDFKIPDFQLPDFQVIDENLRAAMRFFGEASGSGEIRELNGSIAMFSGLDYGVFNIALLTKPIAGEQLEQRLKELARFFKDRTLRWSVWLCEDLLDAAARKVERQVFANFGMREISNPPGMIAEELCPPTRALPAIECRPVSDTATRSAFAEITSTCFDIPYTVAKVIYSRKQAWAGTYRGFVGVVDGRAVSIVAMVCAGGAIGVYSLATLPAYRRHGYGEALLRAAIADAAQRSGLSRMVLQSTDAGYQLYKRMGFQDATRFNVYLIR